MADFQVKFEDQSPGMFDGVLEALGSGFGAGLGKAFSDKFDPEVQRRKELEKKKAQNAQALTTLKIAEQFGKPDNSPAQIKALTSAFARMAGVDSKSPDFRIIQDNLAAASAEQREAFSKGFAARFVNTPPEERQALARLAITDPGTAMSLAEKIEERETVSQGFADLDQNRVEVPNKQGIDIQAIEDKTPSRGAAPSDKMRLVANRLIKSGRLDEAQKVMDRADQLDIAKGVQAKQVREAELAPEDLKAKKLANRKTALSIQKEKAEIKKLEKETDQIGKPQAKDVVFRAETDENGNLNFVFANKATREINVVSSTDIVELADKKFGSKFRQPVRRLIDAQFARSYLAAKGKGQHELAGRILEQIAPENRGLIDLSPQVLNDMMTTMKGLVPSLLGGPGGGDEGGKTTTPLEDVLNFGGKK